MAGRGSRRRVLVDDRNVAVEQPAPPILDVGHLGALFRQELHRSRAGIRHFDRGICRFHSHQRGPMSVIMICERLAPVAIVLSPLGGEPASPNAANSTAIVGLFQVTSAYKLNVPVLFWL